MTGLITAKGLPLVWKGFEFEVMADIYLKLGESWPYTVLLAS